MNQFPYALLAIALVAAPAPALKIAMKSPTQRAVNADTVVVGKVTAIEKETVEAPPFPGAPNKVQYQVAVVQVQAPLAGANNLTHLKVGFIPPPKPAPAAGDAPQPAVRPIRPRPGLALPELKEGQEYVFFLVKHPDAGFYVMPSMSPPISATGDEAKKDIAAVKKVLAAVADPMKALKADKPEDRAFAAEVLIAKYRSYPDLGGEADPQPIPADESKLILKGLAEGDWTKLDRTGPNGMQAFYMLGLSEQDGWVPPKPVPAQPGRPPVNFNSVTKDAFVKWLAGPGQDYRVKRLVPRKK
jgi:hypothetical protein